MTRRGTVARWTRKALRQSPLTSGRQALNRARLSRAAALDRAGDRSHATFAIGAILPTIRRRLGPIDIPHGSYEPALWSVLDHEVDLLGAGATRLGSPSKPLKDRINPSNLQESLRIASLLDSAHQPIDWQVDFRSGFRWSELDWSGDVGFGSVPGVDIKVPWEVSRMQDLVLPAASFLDPRLSNPDHIAREIRNRVLDFIANNPPRYGVNWVTTMDVAIRALNVLMAYDLLRAGGMVFDEQFDAVLRRSMLEHARHIAGKLEWDPVLRGNHYLIDVACLAVLATWLDASGEEAEWLRTGTRELSAEVSTQFLSDGAYFEGSTAYHALALQAVVLACAALLGANQDELLPQGVGVRLVRAVEFLDAVTGPDDRIAQIGDNDSGRIFRLGPMPSSESLDVTAITEAARALLPGEQPKTPGAALIRALSRGRTLVGSEARRANGDVGSASDRDRVLKEIERLPDTARARYVIPRSTDTPIGPVSLTAFPDAGFWVARSSAMHLVIRCGRIGQNGNGGHDHNDQLSFNLWLDGEPLLRDPGTGVYTADKTVRNCYRAAAAHSGPVADGPEPADLDVDSFVLGDARPGECLGWGEFGFAGRHTDRFGRTRLAVIQWGDGGVTVTHGIVGGSLSPERRSNDWHVLQPNVPFSPGYGVFGE